MSNYHPNIFAPVPIPPKRAAKPEVKVHIRWMIRRDFPETLAIENASHPFPWTESQFLTLLRERDHIGMVAELGETIVGFFIYQLGKTKIHVHNFAVHPEYRRRRVGAQMVAKLIAKLDVHRRKRITLNLRESNLDGQLFLRQSGFLATDILREHYEDTGEDAYTMTLDLAVALIDDEGECRGK